MVDSHWPLAWRRSPREREYACDLQNTIDPNRSVLSGILYGPAARILSWMNCYNHGSRLHSLPLYDGIPHDLCTQQRKCKASREEHKCVMGPAEQFLKIGGDDPYD